MQTPTPVAQATAAGAGAACTGVDVDRDLRLAAVLCHDCWCAVARLSMTDANCQGPPEQVPCAANDSTGAGGCIDASAIVDALVSGAGRDGWYATVPRHASRVHFACDSLPRRDLACALACVLVGASGEEFCRRWLLLLPQPCSAACGLRRATRGIAPVLCAPFTQFTIVSKLT